MASSGEIYTGYRNYTRFYPIWRVVEQDIAGNRSLISWEIGVQGSGYAAYWYSNAVKINSGYINGAQVCGSHTYSNISLPNANRYGLRSGSRWVGHNSDGSKSFGASVSGWLYGQGDLSASGSWSLPTIPRNSQVSTSDSGGWDLGTPIVIRTNRKSTSFSHYIAIRLHNSLGTIVQTFDNVGDQVTWTPTPEQIEIMQNAIPNDNRLKIYFHQYNHQVKATSAVVAYTYLRNANPTYSDFTFKDSNAASVAVTGNDQILVKGQSTLSVTIPSASKMTAVKGASANYYSVAYDGVSTQLPYATTDLSTSFTDIATTGSRTILVTAFDSRTNSTRVSKNMTVYDYAAPTITTKLERLNNFDSDTTIHIEGTYTPLTIGGVEKNSITSGSVQYRYQEENGTWGGWVTKTFTASAGAFSVTDFVVSLDNQKKFNVEFRVSDKFGQVTSTGMVDIGTPVLFVGEHNGSSAVGINKMPEQGALDVDGDIYSNGEKVITGGFPSFYAYESTATSMPSGAVTHITMATVVSDTHGGFTAGVYTAPVDGFLDVTSSLRMAIGSTRTFIGGIQINGATVATTGGIFSTTGEWTHSISYKGTVSAGDTIRAVIYHTNASTSSSVAGSNATFIAGFILPIPNTTP